ncbi:MAG: hypothetical protein II458_08560 [Oscillospiraceae bacterium]|nr:hypothetical protein [Oscillospiraceae bacterium]
MIVSILAGLALGLAVAGINTVIMRHAIKKGSAASMMIAVTTRMVLDVAALGAVYLMRGVLPLQFEPTLVAAAVGLSAGIISLAILTSKRNKADGSGETGGE